MKTGKIWIWHVSIDRSTHEVLDAVSQLGIRRKILRTGTAANRRAREIPIRYETTMLTPETKPTKPLVSCADNFLAAALRSAVGYVNKSYVFRDRTE